LTPPPKGVPDRLIGETSFKRSIRPVQLANLHRFSARCELP
jgi:hypothetical protein